MVSAWIFTMPSAGAVGALAYAVANGIGGNAGVILVFLPWFAIGLAFYLKSRKTKVTPDNVNDEWTGTRGRPRPRHRRWRRERHADRPRQLDQLQRPVEDLRHRPDLRRRTARHLRHRAPGLQPPAQRHNAVRAPDDDRIYFGNPWGAVDAGVCFTVVLAAIGLGIYWIVSS